MKKVILFSLVIALVATLVLPTIATSEPAMASSSISCTPTELNFTVYEGVPTTLLGFIPLETQTVTVNSNGGWTAKDDKGWLSLFPSLAFSGQDMNVWVNTDLAVGTYTATITITPFFSSNSVTVPVTVEVIAPKVLGPLMIGIDRIFGQEDEYAGLTTQLLTNPDNMMDMQAIETDGCWNLIFERGEQLESGQVFITGGNLSVQGKTKQITYGSVSPISSLMSMMGGALPIPADFDWGENYVAIFSASDGNNGNTYIGLLLADIGKLLDLLPMLGGLLSGGETAGTDLSAPPSVDPNTGDSTNQPTNNEPATELVIPLKPILNLLSPLMPVMINLLSNQTVLNILKPLMGLLPPIMIIMPMDLMMQLGAGLLM